MLELHSASKYYCVLCLKGISILFVCLKPERSSYGSCPELGSQTGWGAATAGMCGVTNLV